MDSAPSPVHGCTVAADDGVGDFRGRLDETDPTTALVGGVVHDPAIDNLVIGLEAVDTPPKSMAYIAGDNAVDDSRRGTLTENPSSVSCIATSDGESLDNRVP